MKMERQKIYFPLFVMLINLWCALGNTPDLQQVTGCVCTGEELIFQCTTVGAGSTIWSVPCGEFDLLHSRFQSDTGASGSCNAGTIVARSVSVNNNCYTSQLNVSSVNAATLGEVVSCGYFDRRTTTTVGNITIVLSTPGTVQAPEDLQIMAIEPQTVSDVKNITFSWNPSIQNCSTLRYRISSSPECGSCPSETDNTSMTCLEALAGGGVCMISVESIVCGNIVGTASAQASIQLAAPQPPTVITVPVYSQGMLKSIEVSFQMNNIDFNDPRTNYTITYSDSTSGSSCGSAIIPTSSCEGAVCSHMFDVSSSFCPPSTDISITVFATNTFGKGDTSDGSLVAQMNRFVNVQYNPDTTTFICNFVNTDTSTNKSCIVLYGGCDQPQVLYASEAVVNSSNSSLRIKLESVPPTSQFCYIVTASNGTYTVIVEDTFVEATGLNSGSIAGITLGVLLYVIIIIIAYLIFGIVWHKRAQGEVIKVSKKDLEQVDENRNNTFVRLKVDKDCQLEDFLRELNTSLKRIKVFYEFINEKENITEDQEVLFQDKRSKKIYTGKESILSCIGIPGVDVKRPEVKNYRVFVRSKAGHRHLKADSYILYEPVFTFPDRADYGWQQRLIPVDMSTYELLKVTRDCEMRSFIEDEKGYSFEHGCAYFEFCNDEEDIDGSREVLLYNDERKSFFGGPTVLLMIPGAPGTDIKKPKFEKYIVFIQSLSTGYQFLAANSLLLYKKPKAVPTLEDSKVGKHRFEILEVTEDCMLRKFVEEKKRTFIASDVFFEFVNKEEAITDDQEVILIDKASHQFYGGLRARHEIGCSDKTNIVNKPHLEGYRVFVQSDSGGHRFLRAGTNLLYETHKTALMLAAESGHTDTVKELIAAGADVEVKSQRSGETALMMAAEVGHTDTVKELIAAGADVEVKSRRLRKTALMLAAEVGHTDTVKELIAAGADVKVKCRLRKTALMLAAEGGHTDTVKELIAAGADVKVKSRHLSGKTVLMRAAEGGHTDIVKELITAGADVKVKSLMGETALILAAEGGHTDTVKELIAAGADVKVTSQQKTAPSGETYALVGKKHEEAVSGDLYAVTDKKPKKPKQMSEEELAQMYSVPDKSKKNIGLVYADLAVHTSKPPQGQVPSGEIHGQNPEVQYSSISGL